MPEHQQSMGEEEPTQRNPKRKLGCVSLGLIGFGSLVVLLILALFFWNMVASRRLNDNLAKLEAAGFSANREQFTQKYRLDDAEHAGPLFVSGGNALTKHSDMSLPFVGEGPEPPRPGTTWDQLAAAKAYLTTASKQIEMLHADAQAEQPARYLTADGHPAALSGQRPYDQSHRHACRVLSLVAYVHAHEGDSEKVLQALHTGLRVAGSLREEPTSVAQLISVACHSVMMQLIQDMIDLDYSDAELAKLQEAIQRVDANAALVRGLEGEMVSVIEAFHDPTRTGPLPRKQDAAFYVEITQPLLEAADNLPWLGVLQAASDAERTKKELLENPRQAAKYMLALNTVESNRATINAHARLAGLVKVADTLIAAKRFQVEHARLPKSLVELVPKYLLEVPLDPFSQESKPLRLQTANGRTKIYSRGLNLVDDHGSSEIDGPSRQPLDIVMELSLIE